MPEEKVIFTSVHKKLSIFDSKGEISFIPHGAVGMISTSDKELISRLRALKEMPAYNKMFVENGLPVIQSDDNIIAGIRSAASQASLTGEAEKEFNKGKLAAASELIPLFQEYLNLQKIVLTPNGKVSAKAKDSDIIRFEELNSILGINSKEVIE